MTPVGAVRPGPAIELVAAAIRTARDGRSFVARETVERLEQGINDRLTKRLSGLADLGFAPVAGGCGEVRTLIGQDRIRSVDRAHCAKSSRLSMMLGSTGGRSGVYEFFGQFQYGHGARWVLRSRQFNPCVSGLAEQAVPLGTVEKVLHR